MQKWEYLVVSLPFDGKKEHLAVGDQRVRADVCRRDTDILNALGVEGWEVVAAPGAGPVIVKRPKV